MTSYVAGGDFSRESAFMGNEATVVGFHKEENALKEKLFAGNKQLQIISIVGMPGLGKTTLARKVYDDPYTAYHFYLRGWVSVSREYVRRDLLLDLLSCIIQHNDCAYEMSEGEIADEVRKRLKGKRYLIVMDDIWDIRAWSDLRSSFPNDNNGSRIVFTSRILDIGLMAKPDSPIVSPSFLTEDESWHLFQLKVFHGEPFPSESISIGKEIARKCRGLPLAIVLVAGLLANKRHNKDEWEEVLESLSTTIAADQLCMKTLAVSYNHLPNHLKRCFLYFGAFPEDHEIPVQKLIWLWIAEGLIEKIDGKSFEDEAEQYLSELINRSLAIVSKRRSDGRIKTCRVHDLLHEFCLKQVKEENQLQLQVSGHPYLSISSSMRKLFLWCRSDQCSCFRCLVPFVQTINTLVCISPRRHGSVSPKLLLSGGFELLTVLDIISINFSRYPSEIAQLVLLRYLSFGLPPVLLSTFCLPTSISKLCNLEALILRTNSLVLLPESFWEMVRLRHLGLMGTQGYVIWSQNLDRKYPLTLDNLQTVSWVDPLSCSDFVARTPNLRKLGLRGSLVSSGFLRFPYIYFLDQLQKLKLCNTCYDKSENGISKITKLGRIKFPPNLKCLTLEETYLNWDEMSTLGKSLPNLEVLKLLSGAFHGPRWITSEGEFPQLKFLKFNSVKILCWEASGDHFPQLEHLVFVDCHDLEEIPSEIGNIATLQMIEVHRCSPSIAKSARQIKKDQESIGNHYLQIVENCQIQNDEVMAEREVRAAHHEEMVAREVVARERLMAAHERLKAALERLKAALEQKEIPSEIGEIPTLQYVGYQILQAMVHYCV